MDSPSVVAPRQAAALASEAPRQAAELAPQAPRTWRRYAGSLAACALTALVAAPLHDRLDLANTVMLFLLAVALVAVRLGRGPAILAAFSSVALFDFFFVPPKLSLAVSDVQYLVTFAVMLVVALIISHLAAGLKRQAADAEARERRTRALYGVARELNGALGVEQVLDVARRFVETTIGGDLLLLVPGAGPPQPLRRVGPPSADLSLPAIRIASMVFASGQAAETDQLGDDLRWLLLPLEGSTRTRGVLAVHVAQHAASPLHSSRATLEALASLIAATMERLHFVEVAQSAQLRASAEGLRSSILSALSHDVRTPLTALYGLADSLLLARPPLPAAAQETAAAIRDQALRLNGMVANLLDMARLQAGEVKLRKEWQPIEEVIGASIKLLGTALADHPVTVSLEPELPLLAFDAVLLERVFANLLENAAKYSPPGSEIRIEARALDRVVEVCVADRGPGFPAKRLDRVFELFERAVPAESTVPGVGIGLAICRAIVDAHGGEIRASNRPGGGGCVSFTLPRGAPPAVEAESGLSGSETP